MKQDTGPWPSSSSGMGSWRVQPPLRTDWHTHATYYRLGNPRETARIEAMVQRGAELGLQMMGIGEHVNFHPHHPPACYELLAADLRRLQSQHPGPLPIRTFLGAELDILDDRGRLSAPPGLFERTHPDYRIASVHALPDYSTVEQYLAHYQRLMLGAVAAEGGADILGHPWHNADELVERGIVSAWRFERVPQAMLRELVDALRLHRRAIEINARSIADFGDPAYRAFVRQLQSAGVQVAVGSDAHQPDYLDRALPIHAFLLEMGFTREQVWLPEGARPSMAEPAG